MSLPPLSNKLCQWFRLPAPVSASFDEKPPLCQHIGYGLIEPPSVSGAPALDFDFLKKPPSLKNKIIKEHIKAAARSGALKKLHAAIENLDYECEEEGFGAVSDRAKENARRILNAVYQKFPENKYYIYPTEDREIAFDCNPQKGRGALILCDSSGGAACFSTLDGRNSRFRCDSIADFPYDYLWKIFKQFDKKPDLKWLASAAQSGFENGPETGENSHNAAALYSICGKSSFFSEALEASRNFKTCSYA